MSLFAEAKKYIAGGVNSPVRAFAAVGGDPVFIKSAKGAWLQTEDDVESGHLHEIGTSSHLVPAGIPDSTSPSASSKT